MALQISRELTVLVVDDNPHDLYFLAEALAQREFKTVQADSGQAALMQLHAGPVDAMLLDLKMPDMDGLDVLRELRRMEVRIPTIMMSGSSTPDLVVETLEHGAIDFVTKPMHYDILAARIRTHARRTGPLPGLSIAPITFGPGTVLRGKYRLREKLGDGTFGTVYRADHLALDCEVAVKVLHRALASQADAVARFRQEGALARQVQHPNAVAMFDADLTDDGVPFLVMELVVGHSLRDRMREAGTLGLTECGRVVDAVCGALAAAHDKGVIHRDVKPENIIICGTEDALLYKLADFGIATRVLDDETVTEDGRLIGTPAYMAPERLRNEPFDGRSDMFSLGVLIYEALSGVRPFESSEDLFTTALNVVTEEARQLHEVAEVHPNLSALVMSALSKVPDRRPWPADFAQAWTWAAAGSSLSRRRPLTPPVLQAQVPSAAPTLQAAARRSAQQTRDGLGRPELPKDCCPVADMDRVIRSRVRFTAAEVDLLRRLDGKVALRDLPKLVPGFSLDAARRVVTNAWRAGLITL